MLADPPPPFPLALPPQDMRPREMSRSRNPMSAGLYLLLRGFAKSSNTAKVVPPADCHKSILSRFAAVEAAVVFMVSVEACAFAPVIVTELGFSLQVGMSLTLVSAVVTVQVRFTAPLNPLIPITLIVPVLAVVVPGAIDRDVVPPDPGATLGSLLMLRLSVVTALREADVPVMVTDTPEVIGTELEAERVSI